ncbi:uncharacterized protein MKK02DRAFT_38188 [Dioszegia hungarica]|uniref:Uncharacterized protein n=1 Tax=Dioszegia hungarica TaxID=4972 RepID=A0AA38H3J7_9TREE|nr:uncharacterized protein MKK02DRAFT_38188 [Dioszegia hungarica]KAI9633533.1 hypothetical protein MKK02DRAFT_38188 [Dioszegia hungarica]
MPDKPLSKAAVGTLVTVAVIVLLVAAAAVVWARRQSGSFREMFSVGIAGRGGEGLIQRDPVAVLHIEKSGDSDLFPPPPPSKDPSSDDTASTAPPTPAKSLPLSSYRDSSPRPTPAPLPTPRRPTLTLDIPQSPLSRQPSFKAGERRNFSRPLSAVITPPPSSFSFSLFRRSRLMTSLSPTPASLDRDRRVSVWRRLSGVWRWSGPVTASVDGRAGGNAAGPEQAGRKGMDEDRCRTMTMAMSVIALPTVEEKGSGRIGRIPSMVDLRDIGKGMEAAWKGLEAARHDIDGTAVYRAVSRQSAESGIMPKSKQGSTTMLIPALPPRPQIPDTLLRPNVRQASIKVKHSPRKRSTSQAAFKLAVPVSRSPAGHKRSSSTPHVPCLPTAYPQPGTTDITTPPPGSRRQHRRPPSLRFAREIGMPHLWLEEEGGIAAVDPGSQSARPPHSQPSADSEHESAYDGMEEVQVTPYNPWPAGPSEFHPDLNEKGRGGSEEAVGEIPRLPPIDTAPSSSFHFDWEMAVVASVGRETVSVNVW